MSSLKGGGRLYPFGRSEYGEKGMSFKKNFFLFLFPFEDQNIFEKIKVVYSSHRVK